METATETFAIPAALRAALQTAAAEEHRPVDELLRDAVERYLSERHWLGGDVVHNKIRAALESLSLGRGLDGETVMAELLAELDMPEHAR